MSSEELFAKIKEILSTEFEVEAEKIVPEANLANDLEPDSIDFIDLIGKTREFIPGRIDPEIFRSVRTMQDAGNAPLPYTQKQ